VNVEAGLPALETPLKKVKKKKRVPVAK
jgi:hypothetical protein